MAFFRFFCNNVAMRPVNKNGAHSLANDLGSNLMSFLSDKFPKNFPSQEHFLSLLNSYKSSGLSYV
jgi:hypothetical protein